MSAPAAPVAREPRRARRRGAAESLGSIVLAFESIVVFLGGLVAYGLKTLPAGVEQWWGIVAGAVLALAMLLTSGLLRHRWAIGLGWALQVIVILGGFLVPALVLVGLVFAALYGYATIKGASLDKRNAQLIAEAENEDGD